MLRTLRSRRRPRYGAQACAVVSALLLLLSVSLLHTRLSSSPSHHPLHSQNDAVVSLSSFIHDNSLVSDSDSDNNDNKNINDLSFDKIDELDTFEDQNDNTGFKTENGDLVDGEQDNDQAQFKTKVSSSGYFVDHVTGSIRRGLNKRSIDDWDYDSTSFGVGLVVEDDKSKATFGSDDIPIDEQVRSKVSEVGGIEDALLLKIGGKRVSPLREGWGDWFDKKMDFLRRDRMFKSNFEVLNPLNNPLLQDPDGVGVTGLTRGDKAVQKLLLSEFKKTPFLFKRTLSDFEMTREGKVDKNDGLVEARKSESEMKRGARRTLDENVIHGLSTKSESHLEKNVTAGGNEIVSIKDDGSNLMQDKNLSNGSYTERDLSLNGNLLNDISGGGGRELRKMVGNENGESKAQQRRSEELSYVYADGKRWGYFPGLHPHLSFSDFMNSFFRKGKCNMRVFMVWNSPSWMFGVRHQRGLESLLSCHRDACVVVFSETIELDFFKDSFVKDRYKVAVVMPNLDELLKDTPTYIFASVWFQWRKTKFYPTHYSELVRLAALYKYGGMYLDSDIIVLNPLSSLHNTVGLENHFTRGTMNGAVMAFRRHSPFILECMKEFYMTYDDNHLRWNGADLLTRVARNFSSKENKSIKQLELQILPSYIFCPIDSQDITRYFTAPSTENEIAQQDAFFKKILSESLTFHFWNSLTYSLIPEPGSLVARIIDHPCIRCFDLL